MSKKRRIVKDIIKVTFSNITTIISGIIIGFIIPKVVSVDGYGFYKTFTLYATYVGLFSFGIIDGIVLEYGGIDYSQYDKYFFRSIFKWYILIHSFFGIIFLVISLTMHDRQYSFLLIMLAIYMIFSNVVGFFQQISQITQRFKEYSIAKVTQSLMKIFGGLIMIAIYLLTRQLVDYRIYIFLITLGFILVSSGYLYLYRGIVFGKAYSLISTKDKLLHFSSIGFPLMFANLSGTLILTLDRQFVNILFSKSEYAVYSFAYNMLSLVTVATSAISTVLFPTMKRSSQNELLERYHTLISILLICIFTLNSVASFIRNSE